MSLFKKILLSLALLILSVPVAFAADPWPADATGVNLSEALMAAYPDFEPSGVLAHSSGDYFLVDDGGRLARISNTGDLVGVWTLSGDLEGITYFESNPNLLYFASESANAIVEWDLASEAFTGKTWTLDLPRSGGNGFEALAAIPASSALSSWPTGTVAYFAASSQASTQVYFYAIDLSSSASVRAFSSFSTPYYDMADMDFHAETKQLYVLFDTDNKMKEYSLAGTQTKSYTLPTRVGEEGLSLQLNCSARKADILIADDVAGGLVRYANYPIDCDQDGDGYFASEDCDDTRAAFHRIVLSYPDRDRDTLGDPSGEIAACLKRIGYVLNGDDTNDSISNFGVEITGDGRDNDGDGEIDEVNTLGENGPHPHYSTLEPTLPWRFFIASTSQVLPGYLDVLYLDNSVYRYAVFPSSEITSWDILRSKSYAFAFSASEGKSKRVNMLTGL